MDRPTIVIAVISVFVLAGIIGVTVKLQKDFKPRTQCVEHSNSLSMHIHPSLQINVNGAPVPIPANIGITPTCMMAIHTHDETGKVHLEYPQEFEFKLADFFANWDQPFSKDRIMENVANETQVVTMTVDGQPSEDFENLVLKDDQQIVVNYGEKK